MADPRLSVVVRSFNRLPALCELLALLLAQDHDSFEIVVIDQSTERPTDAQARLDRLGGDPRLHVHHFPPLGGARARNEGVARTRGEIVVFIDDDDLPVGAGFLAAMEASFTGPEILGVTCRHSWEDDRPISFVYRALARRLCMRFSPLLRIPHNFPRHDELVPRVDYVHGTGGAYRREVFARVGGWDEDTPIEDETSLGLRLGAALRPGERLVFDPRAHLRRRFDVAGGLGKRAQPPSGYFRRFMTFVHRVLGRYHPWRVRALYPLYVVTAWRWTVAWMWDDSPAHATVPRKLWGTLAFTATLPAHALRSLGEPLGRRPGSGESLRARMG